MDGSPGALDGSRDPEPRDAAPVVDGLVPFPEAGGPLASPLGLDNPSFEPEAGSAVGTIGGSPNTGAGKWQTCLGTTELVASADLSGGLGPAVTLSPSEGTSFLRLALVATGPGAIFQVLDAPLVAGRRYALAVDVASSGVSMPRLELRSGKASCQSIGGALAATPNITAGGTWKTHCLAFTASAEVSELALVMSGAISGVSLYVDNLRIDPSCI